MKAAMQDGCIHHVRRSDPPFLFHRGEGYELHRLPVDTRVIYPRPPVPALPDVRAAIEDALTRPLECEPLAEMLRPGMKVTIAFDDISLPLPRMKRPDVRQLIMEAVIEKLDAAGVTDIELICAICLHRRLTPRELRRMVGRRVWGRFWPDHLRNHDAEDPDGNLHLGETDHGEVVEINRRAAESDLIIYVNINMVTMDGGHKSVPVGLATYRSVRAHHNVRTMMTSCSYMDPATSSFHASCDRMGQIVAQRVRIFTIETTLNNDTFSFPLTFLNKHVPEWSLFDRLGFGASSRSLRLLPFGARRRFYHMLPSAYGVTSVQAGLTGPVHARTLENVHRQQLVAVPGQADIMLVGLPSIGPYNVDSILNPILVQCLAAGYFFNFYRGRPLLRKGGVMIVLHPLQEAFHEIHHPSYKDFYEQVLPETRDLAELEQHFEAGFAANPRYIDLYRNSYAYHGVHPFYMWYWGCHGMDHMERVIVVNPVSRRAAERIGFDIAPSLNRAIDQATELVGPNPQITYFHCPPVVMCDVS
ncbi:MAG: lactate racemase domain-containing protein [Phycisphaerae bacterium]